tara:strand:+ start:3585 stop:4904 length:1320 start_codon:yes stop_codon:yes gene_type:complete
MNRLIEIREKQSQIMAEARTILDNVDNDTPEARTEAESKFDAAMVDFDNLEAEAGRLEAEQTRNNQLQSARERLESADQSRIPGNRSSAESRDVDPDPDAAQWTEDLAFRTFALHGASALPPEARALLRTGFNPRGHVNQNLPAEIRTLVAGTGSAGGFTIPEGFQAELEKAMLAFGPMLNPAVTRELVTPSGNKIPWPTVDDTGNTGEFHAEGSAVTDDGGADPVFGQRELDAFVYDSEIVKASIELLSDTFMNMEGVLGELLGERLGRIGNAVLTTGTGSGQPNGIVTAASVGVTAASATAVTFDEIIDLIHSVDPAYRQAPTLRFMFNDTTLGVLRKIKDGDGNYLWQQADARAGEPASIFGYAYTVNQAMPAMTTGLDSILFGDMNKYVVRKVEGTTVFRFGEKYMNELEIGFMAYNRFDGELINTGAVRKLRML